MPALILLMYEPANAAQLDGKIQVNKFRTSMLHH